METISIYILKMECNFVKIKTIWGIFAIKKASQEVMQLWIRIVLLSM